MSVIVAVTPFAGLLILVTAHVALRFIGVRALLLPFMLIFLSGAAVVLTLTAAGVSALPLSWTDSAGLILLNILTYGGLGFGYFNFVNIHVTSLRTRLLRELWDRREGVPRDELMHRYGTRQVLELRLQRLVGSGHLVFRCDRYYTGRPGVVIIARVFDALAWVILPPRVRGIVRVEHIG